jgi:hypothetical protein
MRQCGSGHTNASTLDARSTSRAPAAGPRRGAAAEWQRERVSPLRARHLRVLPGLYVRSRPGDRPPRSGCMTRHLRGQAVCANALEVRLDDTDAAVLEAVECQLLKVAVLETALYKALAAFEAPQDDAGTGLRDELARLDDEVARLADAIARGGALESLLGMLQDREQRRAHLRVALAEHERQRAAQRQPVDALALMRAALTDWQGPVAPGDGTGPHGAPSAAPRPARLHPRARGLHVSDVWTVAPIIAGVVPNGSGAGPGRFPPLCGGRFTVGMAAVGSQVRSAVRPRTSPAPLSPGRPNCALESGATLSKTPPRGARGGLPRGARAQRRTPVPPAGRASPA